MHIDNLVIDGTNLEFRIFYVCKLTAGPGERNRAALQGPESGLIYRFLYTFNRIVELFNPTNIYCAWDKKIDRVSSNFRKDLMLGKYKAGRPRNADIQEMFDQEVNLIEILETLGVKSIYPRVLEADDVCAYLAHTLKGETVVVSVDQDLLQLVTSTVSVYNLKDTITYENFEEKKGMRPEVFKLYKAIKGDVSDNVSGLAGYGEVRSRKLASDWSTANLTEEYKQIILRNLQVMDLRYGYNFQPGEKKTYDDQMNYVKDVKADINKFKMLCERYNFTTFLSNIDKWKRVVNRNNIVEIINSIA